MRCWWELMRWERQVEWKRKNNVWRERGDVFLIVKFHDEELRCYEKKGLKKVFLRSVIDLMRDSSWRYIFVIKKFNWVTAAIWVDWNSCDERDYLRCCLNDEKGSSQSLCNLLSKCAEWGKINLHLKSLLTWMCQFTSLSETLFQR